MRSRTGNIENNGIPKLNFEVPIGIALLNGDVQGIALLPGDVVEAGAPGEALVGMSDSYDIVVVGSMERQGVVQHLLGSVAEYVVSRAKCNVLTFPAQLEHATPTPANRR